VPELPNDRRLAEVTISIGAVLASIAFSITHLALDPLPNPDGVVYLLAAQAWLEDGYAAAAATYPLPIYSILIACVHSASGLSLLTSAHCLDAALIAGLIVGMQRLAAALGGGVRVQVIVVVLALLLPELNGYRSFLLRDFAYWMFAVLALVFLARHAVAPTLMRAAAFVVMCALAAAFRAEALVLMAAMPLALLSRSVAPRAFLTASRCVLGVIASVALLYVALTSPATTWLSQALDQGIRLAAEVPERIHGQIAGFGTQVLDPRFHDYAAFGVAGGLATMIAVHVFNAASLPLTAIAIVGLLTGSNGRMDRRATPVMFVALGVAILALAVVLMARGIIQTRYAMAAGLLIVVIAAFAIDDWYRRAGVGRGGLRWMSALLVAYFLGEAGFGLLNSKQHYVDASDWLAQHTASDARIFSNDLRVVYLAGRTVDWRAAGVAPSSGMKTPLGTYDYWVTNGARDGAEELAHERGLIQVAQFANRKGQTLQIYSTSPPTAEPGRPR
jgi:hypothetical protein